MKFELKTENDNYSKIKNEVVPLGLKINSKNKKLNRYTSGKSWNKLISNKETLVIDARKPFEYDVGTFKNSVNPNIQNFKDFRPSKPP